MAPIDPQTLAAAYDAHGAVLVLYARQWLDAAASEDVVQDAFIAVARQAAPPQNVKAWLYRAVRNAALNASRAAQRRARHEQRSQGAQPRQRDAHAQPGEAPPSARDAHGWFEPRVDDLIDGETARAALATLPTEQREVLVLRIWGGMTLAEIAGLLAEPVSTLHSRCQAGLAALRRQLEPGDCRTESPCRRQTN
jgi:RNA polymerase sigma-70 factor (ECF subfamily)